MNLYHCMFDLKDDAKAITFAAALDDWMTHLAKLELVQSWRLLRLKLNLSSDAHRDFLLEIEVDSLAHLDALFAHVSSPDDDVGRLYDRVHQMVRKVEYGLYRPYPDPRRVERAAVL